MSRHLPPRGEERESLRTERRMARSAILAAANRNRPDFLFPFTLRHIQRAACKVRRFRLVKPEVLVLAGFKGY